MIPLIRLAGVTKATAGSPLRLEHLELQAHDRVVLGGLDPSAAELLIHLVTGAALPEDGDVEIAGHSTRTITTDTEWLTSLDRFGLVTDRAVLIGPLPVESNLALPLTVSIDPLAVDMRDRVRAIGADVGLSASRLSVETSALSPAERLRVHLARALAPGPSFLLLEDPTRTLAGPAEAASFGKVLADVTARRRLGWLALSDDAAFAEATEGRRLRLDAVTGQVRPVRDPLLHRLIARMTGFR